MSRPPQVRSSYETRVASVAGANMDIEPRLRDTSKARTSAASRRIPARNPVTPSGRGFRAKFFSAKNNRLIRCESLLEFDCLHLFEFARGVEGFVEQPKTIRYRLGSQSRTYTPDFAIDWTDGRRWFIEVKPAEVLAEPRNQEKFDRLSDVFRSHGDKFVVLTDLQIQRPVRLKQVKRLLQVRYGKWLDGTADAATPLRLANRTIAEALRVGSSGRAILHRLASRELVCCLDEEITGTTLLLPFEESHDAELFA
ncbi:TnsA endonuclease N terminal [Burkholderia pseudomallei]|nr:TnsA endonuclease N terminal [Burkholderia pseudomallei]CAJ2955108.1 TnsA endonuclease N terminal [Burkholderia pseudomallei]CAJ3540291.1 TnsA endonuclease N terminal [Burkholderia pseudomallei]CAJ3545455.1 TnsA endonuclease N terminal [Burkholderia pseudomallei]CAJ4132479.1 TnsA endonuclease N terminal [Burkholderia pseudomallei]